MTRATSVGGRREEERMKHAAPEWISTSLRFMARKQRMDQMKGKSA